jgi:regulator of sirC expression with transglutaminase-like and TPR domain
MIRINREIEALVSLLDDPDTTVHMPVIEKLVEHGEPAVKLLEYRWELSANNLLQERIENVILLIQRAVIRKELKDWSDCRGDQLVYGAYLIAKSHYPELLFAEVERKIEALRAQIWLEMNNRLTAMEKVRVINHFLFSVHKFNRSVRGVQSPQLFFINHVLDTRKGLPVTLSVIYSEIAARLELPIYCVDLPHNFLVCYQDPGYLDDPDGILFYINPYSQGTILSRDEVKHFLKQQKMEVNHEYMRPCSNIETIERLADGLRFAYSASRMDDKAAFIGELTEILKRGKNDQIL